MASTSASLSRSSNRSIPVGATAPRRTMSLNIACRLGSSLRRSGVELGPRTWQREHSWMNLSSPARMRSSLAVCTGGFGTGGSTRGGGVGTGGPPSLKAMIRLTFRNFKAALSGGIAPTVMAAPP